MLNTWGKLPKGILDGVHDGKINLGTAEDITKLKSEQVENLVNVFKDTGTITGSDVSDAKRISRDMEVSQITMNTVDKDWDNLLSKTKSQWEIFEEHVEQVLSLPDDQLRPALEQKLVHIKTRTLA